MKKSLYFLVIGFYVLFATDRSKFDLLTNFNNFKKGAGIENMIK